MGQSNIVHEVPRHVIERKAFMDRKAAEAEQAALAEAERKKREYSADATAKKLAAPGQKGAEIFDAIAAIRERLATMEGNYAACMALVEAGKQKVDEAREGWLANDAAPEKFQLLTAAGAEHAALITAQGEIANLSQAYRGRILRSDETTTALYDAIKALQTKLRTRICALNNEWVMSNAKNDLDGMGGEHPGSKELAARLSQIGEAILWIENWQEGNKRETSPWEKFNSLL